MLEIAEDAITAAPFDKRLARWFRTRKWKPFAFQQEVWDAYARGESGLIHAATGTGKTYAAWLGPVLEALRATPRITRSDKVPETAGKQKRITAKTRAKSEPLRVLWITPLRALAGDTEQALRAPIEALGLPWTIESRTGDTTAAVRRRQRDRLPTALITTPESLSLLLCRTDHRELFAKLQCVVVDEWHELMSTKRGVQVELGLARLRAICPALRTWGLSATLGNLHEAAATLLGMNARGVPNDARLVQGFVPKHVEVETLVPETMERFPWAGHLNTKLLPQVMERLRSAESAIVFTNTRSQCEIWFQSIIAADPAWFEFTAIHHGSLDRARRQDVEDGLKTGRYRVVVATSSLDLGVDFAPVDLVMQIGSPKGVARLLQRAGRSGHSPGRVSRIVCVPTHAFELVEVAAARDAIAAGKIESRDPVDRPLDLLTQHLVTLAVGGGFTRDGVLRELRSTRAFSELTEVELDWALDFITRGGNALKAYPEYAKVVLEDGQYVVANALTARRHMMNIGTIVSDASISVRYLRGGRIGSVEESFIARLSPGDKFIFAGTPLEFVRVRDLTAWVRRAKSVQGAIPRWMGARMPLSTELSLAVRSRLERARTGDYEGAAMEAVRPVLELQAKRSAIPKIDELLVERNQTREGHHLWIYPFEGRLVHEGLAALFAFRMAQIVPISFSFSCNDYGFELLSPDAAPLLEAIENGLFSSTHLLADIVQSLNAAELARRQFREIARVAGLVFAGYPGQSKSLKQVQASSGLLYDVFVRYDPDNLLVQQAHREVLERQLEASRLGRVLQRLRESTVRIVHVDRATPLAFPLLVDSTRARVSTEKLADRVRRMTQQAERASVPGAATIIRPSE
ncbi:MAG: ligase-associated DNA damage response DEXH box helicase [Gemmatimonadota bacterium]|nr:ligase-associated DNA damage response DEXH box helicase [Gemmatimonadota bacterium]